MGMIDDLLAHHGVLFPSDGNFLDLCYLHSKLLERLKEKAQGGE